MINLKSPFFNIERIQVIENLDSIEFIYKETSTVALASNPPKIPTEKVFKIVFSCVDGKWHKSDRIYGQIIPPEEEQYIF